MGLDIVQVEAISKINLKPHKALATSPSIRWGFSLLHSNTCLDQHWSCSTFRDSIAGWQNLKSWQIRRFLHKSWIPWTKDVSGDTIPPRIIVVPGIYNTTPARANQGSTANKSSWKHLLFPNSGILKKFQCGVTKGPAHNYSRGGQWWTDEALIATHSCRAPEHSHSIQRPAHSSHTAPNHTRGFTNPSREPPELNQPDYSRFLSLTPEPALFGTQGS
jgi:hypothetical protein